MKPTVLDQHNPTDFHHAALTNRGASPPCCAALVAY
jgi:hypothetical protein